MTNPFKGETEESENKENNIKEDNKAEVNPDAEVIVDENSDNDESTEKEDNTSELSELDKLKSDYEKLNNQYIRLAADFDNYRKRQAQERESLLKYGAEDTLKKLIEVLDNFDRGEKAIADVEDCEKVKESFNLVHKQLNDALSKVGLEVIECEGKEFDPNFHEAVMQTPTSEYPEHTIIAELQKGYKLGDRVLRPSLVNVATAE